MPARPSKYHPGALLVCALFDLTVIGGTVYIIQFWEWSPWWFLVGMLMADGTWKYAERQTDSSTPQTERGGLVGAGIRTVRNRIVRGRVVPETFAQRATAIQTDLDRIQAQLREAQGEDDDPPAQTGAGLGGMV